MDLLKNGKEWIELLFPLLVFLGIYLFQAGFVTIRFSEKGVLLVKPGNFLEPGGFSPDTAVGGLTLACRLVQ